jgi:hypothetical protein
MAIVSLKFTLLIVGMPPEALFQFILDMRNG